mmetsp:Transcript_48128/g.114688  ORF Transcript_48128/g.114688 Transcript_48128/m.114688 type:complete len:235 (-) Transcript_48128:876-1580(-)
MPGRGPCSCPSPCSAFLTSAPRTSSPAPIHLGDQHARAAGRRSYPWTSSPSSLHPGRMSGQSRTLHRSRTRCPRRTRQRRREFHLHRTTRPRRERHRRRSPSLREGRRRRRRGTGPSKSPNPDRHRCRVPGWSDAAASYGTAGLRRRSPCTGRIQTSFPRCSTSCPYTSAGILLLPRRCRDGKPAHHRRDAGRYVGLAGVRHHTDCKPPSGSSQSKGSRSECIRRGRAGWRTAV